MTKDTVKVSVDFVNEEIVGVDLAAVWIGKAVYSIMRHLAETTGQKLLTLNEKIGMCLPLMRVRG